MPTRYPLSVGEWYHCYNRGVDKRKIFQTEADYERFLLLMYVGNASVPIHISNLKEKEMRDILGNPRIERGEPLVEIGAYSLMPNHFHFVLKEIQDGGIASFMQKTFTGYTMYFNKKNERTGALLAGTFKSKHIEDDRYLKHLISYVHMNPVELYEPEWKNGYGDVTGIEKWLSRYQYSSLPDFRNHKASERLERKLLGDTVFTLFDSIPSTQTILEEAQKYYQGHEYQG